MPPVALEGMEYGAGRVGEKERSAPGRGVGG